MTIISIIVTFNPEIDNLYRLFRVLSGQVTKIVIVDNGSDFSVEKKLRACCDENVSFISLANNLGIAAAQNIGIEWAETLDPDYIILFDHDSEPALDMVGKLVDVAERKSAAGVRVAAVGPRYLDVRQNNPPPFIRINGLRLDRLPCQSVNDVQLVDYLVASGCLIPMSTLKEVGSMREDLFIDYVDIEWGLRAKHRGYQSYGACGAVMNHELGDYPIEIMGRTFPLRGALRHYYMFRNATWLYKQSWLPLEWKLVDGWRLLLKFGFYSIFAKPQYKHFWMMMIGVFHGLINKMDKYGDHEEIFPYQGNIPDYKGKGSHSRYLGYFNYLRQRSFLGHIYRNFWLYRIQKNHLHGQVLDIGCGIGDFLAYYKGAIGVDINPYAVDWCKKRGLDARLMDEDSLPFEDREFDSVVLDNVLEHLADPDQLIREIRRVLRPGGRLVVGVPGVRGYAADSDHKKFYSEQDLVKTMADYGLGLHRMFFMPVKSRFLDEKLPQYCLYGVFERDQQA